MCVKYVAFQAGEACEKAELAEALPSWRSGCFMGCFLWLRRLPALGNPLSRLWLNAGLALTLAWRFLGGFPGASAVLDAAISGLLFLFAGRMSKKAVLILAVLAGVLFGGVYIARMVLYFPHQEPMTINRAAPLIRILEALHILA